MTKKFYLFASITFAVIITLGILAYLKFTAVPKQYFIVETNGVEKKITLLHSHEVQKSERKFVDKEVKLLFELSSESETPLYMPADIKTDIDGNIYAREIYENSIKVYSPEGKFIRKYGRSGEGPGEFNRLGDFFVTEEKKIYALDNNKVVLFDNNDIKEIKLKMFGGPSKILPIGMNEFLLLKTPLKPEDGLLGVFNEEGKETSSFEILYKASQKWGSESVLFYGEIFKSSFKTIFISQYFNLLFFYKGNKVDKVITTIDKEEHPSAIVQTDEGHMTAAPNHLKNEIINKKTFLINDSLYIMSMPARKEYKKFIFDMYDASTGKYAHSIRFNHIESFMSVSLSKDRLFIVDANGRLKVYGFD